VLYLIYRKAKEMINMKYYRVKKDYDNATKFVWDTRKDRYGYVRRDGILIGGELYTEIERSKIANSKVFFEEVEIPKSKIYFSFGARFS